MSVNKANEKFNEDIPLEERNSLPLFYSLEQAEDVLNDEIGSMHGMAWNVYDEMGFREYKKISLCPFTVKIHLPQDVPQRGDSQGSSHWEEFHVPSLERAGEIFKMLKKKNKNASPHVYGYKFFFLGGRERNFSSLFFFYYTNIIWDENEEKFIIVK